MRGGTRPWSAACRLCLALVWLVPPPASAAAKEPDVEPSGFVGLLVPRVDLGRASIEAEILDSVSGERLVAVVATREPHRFGGIIKGSKEWGDVKAAFKKWAKQFRKKLDRAHSE